jgi:ribosomal-protein-serine acetyltransferase
VEQHPARYQPRIIPAGEDLELRPVDWADESLWLNVVEQNLTRLCEWMPWARPDYSTTDNRGFLERVTAENRAGEALTCGIWTRGQLAGAISFHRFGNGRRTAEIGYWICRNYQGAGLMSRACGALIAEGFEKIGLHRIEIRCATGNHRSRAIPTRLGFREEGILRDAEWLPWGSAGPRWVDLAVFGMLAGEYSGTKVNS